MRIVEQDKAVNDELAKRVENGGLPYGQVNGRITDENTCITQGTVLCVKTRGRCASFTCVFYLRLLRLLILQHPILEYTYVRITGDVFF